MQKEIPYIILSAGIENKSKDTVIVKKIMPLAGGKIFTGKNLTENLRILDGNGGAEETFMRDYPNVRSRNNFLIHFGNQKESHSLVMGGITYNEFNKFAQIGKGMSRRKALNNAKTDGMNLLAYIDLGIESKTKSEKSAPQVEVKD